jgi:glycine/D-amino acid oxidase-like deaminating enzyme
MKITKLPIDPGPAAWNSILPKQKIQAPLDEAMTADYLIIGAGYAGLSAAYRLKQLEPTAKIIILEASALAHGPAGRNSGFMIDLPHDLSSNDYGGGSKKDVQEAKANRQGIAFAKDMAEAFSLSQEAFSLSGKINGAASSEGHKHNLDYATHLDQMDEKYSLLDAQQMKDITGIDYYQSGLFTPGTALIQPASFVRGIAQGLRDHGVEIYENSPVVELSMHKNWTARTPKGQVTAPKVILCVNGHLNSFGYEKQSLMHVFTYASMTHALGTETINALGGEPRWGITPSHPAGSTVRRISGTGGDRLIIRNRFTYDPSMEVSDRRLKSVAKSHRKSFDRRFGQLGHLEMEYVWGGRLCLSRNNVSVFGEIETNLFSACCHNGLGTAKGTFFGGMAADLATGQTSEMLNYATSEEPPQKLPIKPLAYVGVNSFIKWQEFNAGRDF